MQGMTAKCVTTARGAISARRYKDSRRDNGASASDNVCPFTTPHQPVEISSISSAYILSLAGEALRRTSKHNERGHDLWL